MSKKYLRNPDVVLREEDEGGALLFNPDSNEIKVVNFTGLLIWNACDGNHDILAIAEELSRAYDDITSDGVVSDTEEFVKQLVDIGLVGVVES